MNFLAICQRVRQECGIPGTGPSAVTNQVGELKRVVDWSSTAWTEIQNRHPNWLWMRRPFTFNTVSGTDSYAYSAVTDVDAGAAITRCRRWWVHDWNEPAQAYLQSTGVSGQFRLQYMPLADFRWIYKHGTQTSNQPVHITVDEQRRILLGPKPNGIYVVTGMFQRGAQVLAANADVPECPEDYHMAIVGRAMEKVGRFDAAQEVYLGGIAEGNRLLRQLEAEQLPGLALAEPLA